MFEWINDNPYTCPVLFAVQAIVRRQRWSYGCDGWRVMDGPQSCASSMWPEWLVLTEYRFWNSWVGMRLRVLCGNQQQAWRLEIMD